MVKLDVLPMVSASRRRMRTHAEWKVEIHIPCALPPSKCSTRSRISFAALLVNVIARISLGHASRLSMRPAMRRVSTLVLPDPAPATMRSAWPRYSAASRCCGFSPAKSRSLGPQWPEPEDPGPSDPDREPPLPRAGCAPSPCHPSRMIGTEEGVVCGASGRLVMSPTILAAATVIPAGSRGLRPERPALPASDRSATVAHGDGEVRVIREDSVHARVQQDGEVPAPVPPLGVRSG